MRQLKNIIGFSLIEVAVAIALLALIFGGTLAVFDRGAIASRKTQNQAIAYNLIREKLEEKSNAAAWPPTSEAMGPVSGFTGFQRQVTVTNPYLGSAALSRISVTVQWNGAAQSQTIETIKANY